MRRVIFTIIGIFLLTVPAFPSLLESVLKDGIGVRPLGMGGAFTTISDDPCRIFYNPAGYVGEKLSFIQGAVDVKRVGYLKSDYSVASIKDYTFANWYLTDLASNRIEVTGISYTRSNYGFSYGITLKNVYGATTSEVISGYSFDLGLKGKLSGNMVWGVNFQDLYEVDLGIPASIRGGVAINFGTSMLAIEGEGRNLLDPAGSVIYPHIGFEAMLTNGFVGRVGYDKDYYTAGFSIEIPAMNIDYAIAINRDYSNSDSIQRIGFSLGGR